MKYKILARMLACFVTTLAQAADWPSAYSKCADEGGACQAPSGRSTRFVSYGAKNSWVTKTLTGTIQCTTSTFGRDPKPGVTKKCANGPASATSSNSSSSSSSSGSNALSGVMKVSGRKILDANGREFVARGTNLQYGDWPPSKIGAIDPIASTGANIIRLQLRKNTTAVQVREALDKIVAKKMVAMVFYWESDVTCKADNAPFDVAMDRWTNTWKSVLTDAKYKKYLMINPVNEWGKAAEFDNFKAKYRDAIVKLRNAGYRMPIVIDASDCGQSPDAFTNGRAAQILSADTLNNSLLSIHAYWRYTDATKMANIFTTMNSTGYAWLWGELGSSQFQASLGRGTDHPSLMKLSNEQKIGYMAWSWHGSAGDTLNMSSSITAADLTWWGKELVNGTRIGSTAVPGIRATSRLVTY